jgi:hypothetical protein
MLFPTLRTLDHNAVCWRISSPGENIRYGSDNFHGSSQEVAARQGRDGLRWTIAHGRAEKQRKTPYRRYEIRASLRRTILSASQLAGLEMQCRVNLAVGWEAGSIERVIFLACQGATTAIEQRHSLIERKRTL